MTFLPGHFPNLEMRASSVTLATDRTAVSYGNRKFEVFTGLDIKVCGLTDRYLKQIAEEHQTSQALTLFPSVQNRE